MKKSHFLLPVLFILTLGIIVFFQVTSYKSIRELIGSNEELLNEIKYKNTFQQLETHLATFDKLVREAVITKGAVDDIVLKNEIKEIKLSINYIDEKLPNEEVNQLSKTLDTLVQIKIKNGIDILNEYVDRGKQHAELMVYDHNKTNTNEEILKTISDLEKLSEQHVQARVSQIDQSEKNAMLLNVLIAIGACLFMLLALGFIFYKIKQQQRLIQELNDSKNKEKKSSKIKEEFLANMSHEIRTPLNAIIGFTGLLEKEILSEKANKFVTTIKSSSTHLMDIVNEILDIAKIEEGMIRIVPIEFSIHDLIRTIEQSFRQHIEEKGIQFIIRKEFEDNKMLIGDAYRLTQILNNLLSNAQKFTSTGFIELRILCKQKTDTNCIMVFSILDSGIGIATEKRASVFDRFEQGDTHITRKYGGTGLGLSIVKQLIELQGGSITLQSELSKGSEFTFELPFKLAKQANTSIQNQITNSLITHLDPFHILIVEDNPINFQLLEFWFQEQNLAYSIALNGNEALAFLTKKHADIILMDIQMPEMDGYEVTRKLRNELKITTPIIAMTAHALPTEKEKCLALGMNDYISKPISETLLFQLISQYAQPNFKLINKNYLLELSNGNQLFMAQLVNQFLIQAPQEFNALQMAISKNDLVQIKAIAHNMKTTFGYLGIEKNYLFVFEQFEHALSIQQFDMITKELQNLLNRIEQESQTLLTELNFTESIQRATNPS